MPLMRCKYNEENQVQKRSKRREVLSGRMWLVRLKAAAGFSSYKSTPICCFSVIFAKCTEVVLLLSLANWQCILCSEAWTIPRRWNEARLGSPYDDVLASHLRHLERVVVCHLWLRVVCHLWLREYVEWQELVTWLQWPTPPSFSSPKFFFLFDSVR